jgi:hypothetical protein
MMCKRMSKQEYKEKKERQGPSRAQGLFGGFGDPIR